MFYPINLNSLKNSLFFYWSLTAWNCQNWYLFPVTISVLVFSRGLCFGEEIYWNQIWFVTILWKAAHKVLLWLINTYMFMSFLRIFWAGYTCIFKSCKMPTFSITFLLMEHLNIIWTLDGSYFFLNVPFL